MTPRPAYTELQVASNFSFLRGASHPHELVWQAAQLGYKAIGLTDYNTLSGIVRGHVAAQEALRRAGARGGGVRQSTCGDVNPSSGESSHARLPALDRTT
jgi:DNA polymerase III alpha subunit (gram-positive type)